MEHGLVDQTVVTVLCNLKPVVLQIEGILLRVLDGEGKALGYRSLIVTKLSE